MFVTESQFNDVIISLLWYSTFAGFVGACIMSVLSEVIDFFGGVFLSFYKKTEKGKIRMSRIADRMQSELDEYLISRPGLIQERESRLRDEVERLRKLRSIHG